jgi:hypothetical protein
MPHRLPTPQPAPPRAAAVHHRLPQHRGPLPPAPAPAAPAALLFSPLLNRPPPSLQPVQACFSFILQAGCEPTRARVLPLGGVALALQSPRRLRHASLGSGAPQPSKRPVALAPAAPVLKPPSPHARCTRGGQSRDGIGQSGRPGARSAGEDVGAGQEVPVQRGDEALEGWGRGRAGTAPWGGGGEAQANGAAAASFSQGAPRHAPGRCLAGQLQQPRSTPGLLLYPGPPCRRRCPAGRPARRRCCRAPGS